MFDNFEGYDRFDLPEGIIRVTAGHGGESFLILGSERAALYDCGMAYCGDQLVENIERQLGGRQLDVVILSHTHYDHLGGLPYVLKRWPSAKVCGAGHGKKVLERPGAVKAIGTLGSEAANTYTDGRMQSVLTEGLRIDTALKDGETLSLGDETILAMETKGHTDCSMTYVIEPGGIMFASESTGMAKGKDKMHIAILKSYEDSIASLKKCRNYGAKVIICTHYGRVPSFYNESFWELFQKRAGEEKKFVGKMWKDNLSMEDMLKRFKEKYWREEEGKDNPLHAFLVNARQTIGLYRPEMDGRG